MGSILDFFRGIGESALGIAKYLIEPVKEVGSAVIDGISKVKDFLVNAFITLNDLVSIFPIECQVLLAGFLTVASAYLIYKLVRSG